MAHEPVRMSKAGRESRNLVLVILLVPLLLGIIAGNAWRDSDKAGCPMVQSFGAQLGGNPAQSSDTADNCRAAIDAKQGWYTLFGIVGVCILCGGALITLIAAMTVAGRRRKPDVVVVQVAASPSQADARLRAMVSDGTVIVGDPSAQASADDSANL